nr:FAD-dependent isoamyl alcohol dehydrogenase [Trichoderma balearicum]
MHVKFAILFGLVCTAVGKTINTHRTCRVLPGDAAWPSAHDWAALNRTINGHLIATIPEASVCHNSPFKDYNATACALLQSSWDVAVPNHINSPAEILNQNFQNYSCVPFTNEYQSCNLGNYASYVVDVTGADDVRNAIAFAKKHNVRIVIKNTGHDYLGKSTGRGSLSLWTHNLKSTKYIPSYRASYYRGPAVKLGSGVQGWEAYLLANSTGHRMVGGSCPTVGIAGGYSQGGGHSILSSSYGLGSDNVLEWEVVTVDGRHLIATPNQNADLYWAISGGGGGTFAVVLSMTARLHPDGIVGGTLFSFNDSVVGNDAYWKAVGAFHALLPDFLDAGNSFTYSIGNTSLVAYGTMPGANLTEINRLLKPFIADLTHRNITPSNTPQVSPNYYTHFYTYLGPAPYGTDTYNPFTNSRVVPRSLITNPTTNAVVTDMFRKIAQVDAFSPFYCDSFNVSTQNHPDNSLHPAWRDGMILCSPAGSWDWKATAAEMAARDVYAAKTLQPLMDKATPGGLVYLNEANHLYENWKENFFGNKYKKLLSVKKKYDPEGVLYVKTGVGSDSWGEDRNGRLCRA